MLEVFAKSLQIDSTCDKINEKVLEMHKLLEENFPLVHKNFEKRIINGSLLFKYEAEGKPLMFCGHMDVVHTVASDWSKPPFCGEIDDKFVWGRGAIDCKPIVLGVMTAMEQLLEEGFKPTRTIYLAFGHDEEVGGSNGALVMANMLKDEGVELDLVLDEGGSIQGGAKCGEDLAVIGLAEKNILRLKLTAHDAGGHAAYITKKTGLYRIAQAIMAIEENPMPKHIMPLVQEYIDQLKDYPELVENYADKIENNPFVRTTMAPTMVGASEAPNILPNRPYVICDVRMLPSDSIESVIAHVENLVKDLDITIERMMHPKEKGNTTDFNSQMYKNVSDLIKEQFDDVTVVPVLMVGGTDARHYERICKNVIRFAPFVISPELKSTIHAADERIEKDVYIKGVSWYKEFIKRHG